MSTDLSADALTPDDETNSTILALRRKLYGDHAIDPHEITALWQLAADTERDGPGWRSFVREVFTDHYIHQATVPGVLTDEMAADLVARLAAQSPLQPAILDAVVHVLSAASHAPAPLAHEVKKALLNAIADQGFVADDMAQLVRRMIHASGGFGHLAVTRAEADWLFDLNALVRGAKNADAWNEVFANGVAHCLTAGSGPTPPSAERLTAAALAPSPTRTPRLGAFLSRMIGRNRTDGPITTETAYAAVNADRAMDAAAAAALTAEEVTWLRGQLPEDGHLSDAEVALIDRLADLQDGEALPASLAQFKRA